MKISDKFISELTNKEYRDAFVSAHIDTGIPLQIRALRKREGWTQKELAELIGMKQERISALENPNYSKFTITTLKKIASAFNVALIVRFAPMSELVKWEFSLSPENMEPVSFEKDPYFKKTPDAVTGTISVTLPPITAQGSDYIGNIPISIEPQSSYSYQAPKIKPKLKPKDKPEPADFAKYWEAKQRKMENPLPKLMQEAGQ
jgi:transcriptional regulator with XRE-family HTH domain